MSSQTQGKSHRGSNPFARASAGTTSFQDAIDKISGILGDQTKMPTFVGGIEDLYSENNGDAVDAIEDARADLDDVVEQVSDVIADLDEASDIDSDPAYAEDLGTTDGIDAGVEGIMDGRPRRRLSPAMRTMVAQLVHAASSANNMRAYHRLTSTDPGNGAKSSWDQNVFSNSEMAAGIENFDPTDHHSVIAKSIAFTMATLGQGKAAELLYKNEPLSPNQGVYQIRVLIPTIHLEQTHDTDGTDVFDFQQRRLVDATRFPELLKDDLIDVVPKVRAGNLAYFPSPADIAPVTRQRNGQTFNTAPLALDIDIDLIAVNSLEDIQGRGKSNSTDTLGRGIEVKNLYLKITEAGVTPDSSVVRIRTTGTNGSHFSPFSNGRKETELTLVMDNTYFISADTLSPNGAAPAILEPLFTLNPNLVIAVRLNAHGICDYTKGTVSITSSQTKNQVVAVYERGEDSHRRTTVSDPATLAAVDAAFGQLQLIGFDPDARISNQNRRDNGYIVRLEADLKQYPVYLNSPFTARTPLTGSYEVEMAELRKMAYSAARISNDLAVHGSFWDVVDRLKATRGMVNEAGDWKWANHGFAADPYIDPIIEEVTADVYRGVQALNSAQKLMDVQAYLMTMIQDLGLYMIRESNINAALDVLGYPDYKVELVVITDTYTAGYLNKYSEGRNLGTEHKMNLVSLVDERWRDKISVTLRVTLEGNASILNFGRNLTMPRLVTDLPLSRDNSHVREVTVQTRRLPVTTCPIVGVINVVNLRRAVRELTPFTVAM